MQTLWRRISGGRSVHHTIRLLQIFGYTIKNSEDQNNFNIRSGFYGPTPWVPGRSYSISGDMDELLINEILPQFLRMFRRDIWEKLEHLMMREIAPLWWNLRD